MKLNKNLLAFAIFSIIALMVVLPIFKNIGNFGVGDWDQHFVYNEVPRKTIIDYGQIPLWNPYYCGGNVELAHPESPIFYPGFILVLMFGTVVGLKLQIFIHLILGMFGLYLLSKYLKFGTYSSFLPSIVYFLSSWFALRMNAGHLLYMSLALLPYVFLFYLKAIDEHWKYSILSGVFLALMFFYAATYPIIFTFMFLALYAFLISIQRKTVKPIIICIAMLILTLLFSMVKFLPVYEMTSSNPLNRIDRQPINFGVFASALFSRDQGILSRVYHVGDETWNWHEYGSYIGIVVFALLLLSLFLWKNHWPLIVSMFVFCILTLSDAFYNLWPILRHLPVLSQLTAPTRFNVILIFCIALLSGAALSWIENNNKIQFRKIAVLFILFVVLFDMSFISYTIYKGIFLQKPIIIKPTTDNSFIQIFLWPDKKFNMMYPTILAGAGVTNCYEKMHVPVGAIPMFSTEGFKFNNYKGEAYLLYENRTLQFDYWSPNKMTVLVNNKIDDILIINQNYEKSWKSNMAIVENKDNLISVKVKANTKQITLRYKPVLFYIGLIISSITLIFAFLVYKNLDLFTKKIITSKKYKSKMKK